MSSSSIYPSDHGRLPMALSEREQGHEDVLKFIRQGRFLHDQAPPAQFAREIETGWRSYGKAQIEQATADEKPSQFRKEIETAINRHSMENGSDTPDYILAEYLYDCLMAFDKAVGKRTRWYGKGREPANLWATSDSDHDAE